MNEDRFGRYFAGPAAFLFPFIDNVFAATGNHARASQTSRVVNESLDLAFANPLFAASQGEVFMHWLWVILSWLTSRLPGGCRLMAVRRASASQLRPTSQRLPLEYVVELPLLGWFFLGPHPHRCVGSAGEPEDETRGGDRRRAATSGPPGATQ